MQIRVLIADDHAPFREGLRRILNDATGIAVVAEASTVDEAEELAATHNPDVAILDVQMPAPNGIAAVAKVRGRSRHTAVMMLSIHGDRQYVQRSVLAGARGYVLKDAPGETIVAAVRCIHSGGTYFSSAVAPAGEEAVQRAAVKGARMRASSGMG